MKPNSVWCNNLAAASILGVAPGTLYRWRKVGLGPAYTKVGSQARYKRSDLAIYLGEELPPLPAPVTSRELNLANALIHLASEVAAGRIVIP